MTGPMTLHLMLVGAGVSVASIAGLRSTWSP
jgi:hypothetical protein